MADTSQNAVKPPAAADAPAPLTAAQQNAQDTANLFAGKATSTLPATVPPPSVLTAAPAKEAVAKVGATIDANKQKAADAKAAADYAAQNAQQSASVGQLGEGPTIKATDPSVTTEMAYWAGKGTPITRDIALANVLSGKAASQAKPATTPSTTTTGTQAPSTGTTPPPTPPPTPAPIPGQENADAAASAWGALVSQDAQSFQNFSSTLDNIASGAYSTPAFQQQVNDIKNSFNTAFNAQQLANDNAQMRLRQMGYTSGLSQVDVSRFQSVLSEAANQGVQKLSDLATQESQAITAATTAFQQQQYQVAIAKQSAADNLASQKMTAAQELYKIGQDQVTNARNAAADERAAAMDALTIASGQQTLQQKTADSLAPGLLASGATPEQIAATAKANGIPTDVMNSSLVTAYQAQQKEAILNSAQTASILGATATGGKVNIPGVGEVTVVGKGLNLSTLQDKTGEIYTFNPATGQTKDLGIKGQDMTLTNILGIAAALKDPAVAQQFLSNAGIKGIPSDVGGYDISSYATNPQQAQNVSAVFNSMASVGTDAASLDQYIQSTKPGSPITGDMVANAAAQYGVDPHMITAIMQAETQLGTDGSKGAKQNNFGNVGNTDTLMAKGGSVSKKTPQDGVNAVAQWLQGHQATQSVAEQQKAATLDRTKQMVKASMMLEANRLVGAQIKQDATIQNYLKMGPNLLRVEAAVQVPGSVSDQELLDAVTQLDTGGYRPTEAQINVILKGQSYSDALNVMKKKFATGGVLSDAQRQQLRDVASKTYQIFTSGFKREIAPYQKKLVANGINPSYVPITDISSAQAVLAANAGVGSPIITDPNTGQTMSKNPDGTPFTPQQLQEAADSGYEISSQ